MNLALALVAVLGASDDLSRAQQALQRGDSGEGLRILLDASSLLPRCGDLEYDIGTTAAQAGDVGVAVLHLERALRLSPWDSAARANLERIRQKRIDKVMGREPGESPVQRLALGLPGPALFWLALVCWWLGFAALSLPRRRLFAAGLGLLVAATLSGSLAAAWRFESAVPYAVVTSPGAAGVKVHAGPAEDLPPVFEVHAGLKVLLLDEENGFAHVRLGNGLEGFVAQSALETI